MTRQDKIKAIYDGLNSGTTYITKRDLQLNIAKYVRGEWRYLSTSPSLWADKDYIYDRHHGQSAKINTIENLEWILDNIFKDTPIDEILPITLETLTRTMNEGQGSWAYRGEYDRHIIGREI